MKLLVLSLFAFVAICLARVTTPGYVPAVDTVIVTGDVSVSAMLLNNKSAGSVSCALRDRSTNCGSGPCSLWGPAPLGASGSAGSIVSWPFYGQNATNGLSWSCDTANAVVGSVFYQ